MNQSVIASLLVLACLFPQPVLSGQRDPQRQPPAPCSEVYCHPPATVHLLLENGREFEATVNTHLPVVQDGRASVFPGEIVYIEAELKNEKLVNLTAVRNNTHPDRTLVLRFWQDNNPNNRMMLLVIRNPFPETLKYHAVVMKPAGGLYQTSSCPVPAGSQQVESWPQAIFQLYVFGFRVVEDNKCDY